MIPKKNKLKIIIIKKVAETGLGSYLTEFLQNSPKVKSVLVITKSCFRLMRFPHTVITVGVNSVVISRRAQNSLKTL